MRRSGVRAPSAPPPFRPESHAGGCHDCGWIITGHTPHRKETRPSPLNRCHGQRALGRARSESPRKSPRRPLRYNRKLAQAPSRPVNLSCGCPWIERAGLLASQTGARRLPHGFGTHGIGNPDRTPIIRYWTRMGQRSIRVPAAGWRTGRGPDGCDPGPAGGSMPS